MKKNKKNLPGNYLRTLEKIPLKEVKYTLRRFSFELYDLKTSDFKHSVFHLLTNE